MNWSQVRQAHPDQWLIVEALRAHSSGDHRELDELTVVEECADAMAAFRRYQALHEKSPERELYFVHTARETLEIIERQWLGIRPGAHPGFWAVGAALSIGPGAGADTQGGHAGPPLQQLPLTYAPLAGTE
jgi:hypothetical protein